MTDLILPTAGDTHALGVALGRYLGAGDLVIVDGALGAGKTVLAQGIGEGMGVRGPITSPTFVIARVHQSERGDGASMVHVDAYRLADAWEFDDLDLDTNLTSAAVVVEWGSGRADQLSQDHLVIRLERHPDDSRTASLRGTGPRSAGLARAVTVEAQ